jgi:hypothetical protein
MKWCYSPSMSTEANQAVVGDVAKLILHRLIARKIRRDPGSIERAKVVHARQADQFAGWPFVRDWDELLALPPADLIPKLTSRDREMVRLRNSSPFYLAEGVDFGGHDARIRIARAARRVVERGLSARNRENPLPSPGAISEPAAIRGEPVVSGAERDFAREFKDARGKIDADLKLGF